MVNSNTIIKIHKLDEMLSLCIHDWEMAMLSLLDGFIIIPLLDGFIIILFDILFYTIWYF